MAGMKYNKILPRLFRLLSKFPVLIAEFFISLFGKKVRISFINWGDVSFGFFIEPMKKSLAPHNLSCKIVKCYSPHISFFSSLGNGEKIKKSKSKLKIFYTGENVNNDPYIKYKGNCIEFANLSLGFDFILSDNYLRFPLWLLYYFKPFDTKDDISAVLKRIGCSRPKTKFCSMVASHDKSGIRTKMYNDVSKVNNVDCPGKLLHNDDSLHNIYNNNKHLYLQKYKFNICPENSISPGYVTEKLFHSLSAGCIPIYNGWSKNPEPDIVNPGVILWYDALDVVNNERTIARIQSLNSNDNEYNTFIKQPFFCDTAVDKIHQILQQYLAKLQSVVDSAFGK